MRSVARRRSRVMARGTSASGQMSRHQRHSQVSAASSIITGNAARCARPDTPYGRVNAKPASISVLFCTGAGHHGGEFAVHASVAGAVQHLDDVGGIARIELSR